MRSSLCGLYRVSCSLCRGPIVPMLFSPSRSSIFGNNLPFTLPGPVVFSNVGVPPYRGIHTVIEPDEENPDEEPVSLESGETYSLVQPSAGAGAGTGAGAAGEGRAVAAHPDVYVLLRRPGLSESDKIRIMEELKLRLSRIDWTVSGNMNVESLIGLAGALGLDPEKLLSNYFKSFKPVSTSGQGFLKSLGEVRTLIKSLEAGTLEEKDTTNLAEHLVRFGLDVGVLYEVNFRSHPIEMSNLRETTAELMKSLREGAAREAHASEEVTVVGSTDFPSLADYWDQE